MTKITTADLHRRLEQAARDGGYSVAEWLKPGLNGNGMRVACTMFLGGQQHGLGFKWDGESMDDLASRCIALSYSMAKLPEMVAKGKSALWGEQPGGKCRRHAAKARRSEGGGCSHENAAKKWKMESEFGLVSP